MIELKLLVKNGVQFGHQAWRWCPRMAPYIWGEKNGIHLSKKFIYNLKKADKITTGLGLKKGDIIQVSFSLEPDLRTPIGRGVHQISLSIDGSIHNYKMGRVREYKFTWPNIEGVPGANLSFEARPQLENTVINEKSDWGWFKLYDKASIRKLSSTFYRLQWRFPQESASDVVVKYNLRTSTINHPFDKKDYFRLSLPRKLN